MKEACAEAVCGRDGSMRDNGHHLCIWCTMQGVVVGSVVSPAKLCTLDH